MSQRLLWADNAKAIGIFLVVFGHLSNPESVTKIIYSFHMPLFFFLAGVFFSVNCDFSAFLQKKTKTLIVPYFIFGVLTYLFWVCIGRNYGADASLNIPWWRPLVGMFYSVGTENWLVHNTPLWFLTCLYVSEIFLFFVLSLTKKIAFWLIAFSVMGYLFSLYNLPSLPWSLNTAPQAMLFLGVGLFSRRFIVEPSHIVASIVFLVSIAGLVVIGLFNARVDMNSNQYGNYLMFVTSAVCGILATILLAQKINLSPVSLVGRNTLVIFLLHGVAISLWKGFLTFGLGFDLGILESNMSLNFVLAIMVILSLAPVSIFVTKVTPWAIGAQNKK
ncbi:acyltransferase family protein [Teredinibacter turnerae]|uniref:acyltransferase family protein n=1 Tax=Teredinibacter turnerae TaxID=2426 RepID=UPI00035FD377|nr:acyltransferase family protein [Teredinibacter turnerae]